MGSRVRGEAPLGGSRWGKQRWARESAVEAPLGLAKTCGQQKLSGAR
ncbi:hypothetical protein [Paenibacillus sp. MMO-177]